MIDDQPIALAHLIVTTARGENDAATALDAITPAITALRRQLETMTFIGPPRLVGYSPPAPMRGEHPARTADRIRHAVRSLHCARAFGTADDARRVIDEAIDGVRIAAIGRAQLTTRAASS